jgi:hypothetical protein
MEGDMGDRVTYYEMRSWLLDCYYDYCRSKVRHGRGWVDGEYEFAYAYDEFRTSFSSVIESLMLEVLTLVLAAGRGVGIDFHRENINSILQGVDIYDLVAELQDDERSDFMIDLQALGFA